MHSTPCSAASARLAAGFAPSDKWHPMRGAGTRSSRCLTASVSVTMLSKMDTQSHDGEHTREQERVPVAPCPQCGFMMMAVRGSKDAVCSNCGFKDSCCY